MTGGTKRKTLILLGLVMLIMMMIAASLPQLELQPGMPLPRLQEGQVVVAPIQEEEFVSISINKFFIVLFTLILAGVVLYSMYKLLRGADWKFISGFLRSMLVISVLLSGFVYLIMLFSDSGSSYSPVEIPTPTPEPLVRSPLGSVPIPILWLIGIGLFVLSVLVGMWIFISFRPARSIDLVGLEAEKAWQALKTGSDLKDVIIKCYRQMSLALKREQGIEREDFMTTGEFEHLLEEAGIPHEPIHHLTRLFDAVRYGNWQPNTVDEQKAIQCLEAIMLSSRETRRTN
jgi:hypothetical protein